MSLFSRLASLYSGTNSSSATNQTLVSSDDQWMGLPDDKRKWIHILRTKLLENPGEPRLVFSFHPNLQIIRCVLFESWLPDASELFVYQKDHADADYWHLFWRFAYERFSNFQMKDAPGSRRILTIYTSPIPTENPYSTHPNCLDIRLYNVGETTFTQTSWCGLDGPSTCHDD